MLTDRQTYQPTLKHYIFVIGDMSLIDCINVGDCVVQQIRYLPMLFTIPHHLSSVCSGWNVAHLIWISLISEFFFIIWGPACFLLPVKTLCHLDTFWLLTWRAKMLTSLGNPLLHWNRFCNNLWYFLINWPVFLGCWTWTTATAAAAAAATAAATCLCKFKIICRMYHSHLWITLNDSVDVIR